MKGFFGRVTLEKEGEALLGAAFLLIVIGFFVVAGYSMCLHNRRIEPMAHIEWTMPEPGEAHNRNANHSRSMPRAQAEHWIEFERQYVPPSVIHYILIDD